MTADVGTLQRLPKLIPDAVVPRARLPRSAACRPQRAYEVGLVNGVYDTHDELVAGALDVAAADRGQEPAGHLGHRRR